MNATDKTPADLIAVQAELDRATSIVDRPTFARGSTMHRIADYAARRDRIAMARATVYLEERRCQLRRKELTAELDRQRSRLARLYGWIERNVI